MLKIPKVFPEDGFYYHYKHDLEKGMRVRDYAYFICGIGFHTEDDCRPQDASVGIYQPLYEEAPVYQASLEMGVPTFDFRPLGLLMERVKVRGRKVPRFQKITDPNVINYLAMIRNEMYPPRRYF